MAISPVKKILTTGGLILIAFCQMGLGFGNGGQNNFTSVPPPRPFSFRFDPQPLCKSPCRLIFNQRVGTLRQYLIAEPSETPDVAYDSASHHYAVVWDEKNASGGSDIYARLIDQDGFTVLIDRKLISVARPTQGCLSSDFGVDHHLTKPTDCKLKFEPTIAYNNGRFLIAWRLQGKADHPANTVFSGIIGMMVDPQLNPVNANWTEGRLLSQMLLVSKPPLVRPPQTDDEIMSWSRHEKPRLISVAGKNAFLLIWQTNNDYIYCVDPDRWSSRSVAGRVIEFEFGPGRTNKPLFQIYSDNSNRGHPIHCAQNADVTTINQPRIAYNGGQIDKYLVVFEARRNDAATPSSIQGQLFNLNSTLDPRVSDPWHTFDIFTSHGEQNRNPDVIALQDKFLEVHDQDSTSLMLQLTHAGSRGLEKNGNPVPITTTDGQLMFKASHPRLAIHPAGNTIISYEKRRAGDAAHAQIELSLLDATLHMTGSKALLDPPDYPLNVHQALADGGPNLLVAWAGQNDSGATILQRPMEGINSVRIDNCALIANTAQTDIDADGLGDACDTDRDNDGIPDAGDNCPSVANPDQTDSDRDGSGDDCDIDADNDGTPNAADNCPLVANPDQINTDHDALGNICDPDEDNDGIPNATDNCPLVANPGQDDFEHDGVGDVCDDIDEDHDGILNDRDNCPLVSNPDQTDTDHDGLGNACDPDDDDDGIPDAMDNCPLVASPDQTDTDRDGLGDVCDPDNDNDGIPDGTDNCSLLANTNQEDRDHDGIGDACDSDNDNDGIPDTRDNCPTTPNPAQGDNDHDRIGDLCDPDDDNDNIPDTGDNCPFVANPDQTDTDHDGSGDACDIDADNDGTPNAADNCLLISNPDQTDSDGDRVGDVCDPDDDNDGIQDDRDNCPLVANPLQEDGNGDGVGDVCSYWPIPRQPAAGFILAPTRAFLAWVDGAIPAEKSVDHYQSCNTPDGLDAIDNTTLCPNSLAATLRYRILDLLTAGTNYWWKVRACYNSDGTDCSPYSPVQTFSTDDSVAAWWQFEGPSTGSGQLVTDSSGHNNNGDLINGASFVPSTLNGQALLLDGDNDYVVAAAPLIPQNGVATVEGWFYFNTRAQERGNHMYLLGDLLYQHSANNVIYIVGTNDHFDWVPELYIWYHLVLTYSGDTSTAKLYVNGELQPIIQYPGSHDIPSYSPKISNSSSAFDGMIDEFAIYNTALTPVTVTNNFCALEALAGTTPLPAVCSE